MLIQILGPILRDQRLKIAHDGVKTVGYSKQCPKCALHSIGDHPRANHSHHSETCRMRVYQELRRLGVLEDEDG